MSTLTLPHATSRPHRMSDEAVAKVVLWANLIVIVIAPAVLSVVVLARG